MPPPVYSKRFLLEEDFTGTASAGPDAGFLWILRDLDVVVKITIGVTAVVTGIVSGETHAAFDLFQTSAEDQTHQWRGRQIVYPGETVEVNVTGTDDVDFVLSGYELSLP